MGGAGGGISTSVHMTGYAKPWTSYADQLRILLLDALKRIEIALRVDLSYRLGQKGPFAYLDPANFNAVFTQKKKRSGLTAYAEWLQKHDSLIQRSSEKFIQHNRNKYGLPLAIWVACEVWDFGCMSVLFSGLPEPEQNDIANVLQAASR